MSRSCSSGSGEYHPVGSVDCIAETHRGVRGIVAGEVLRRLVARTMAQQLGPAVENFTAPFQFALTTRSGCECVAHTIQALCQADPELTLTSLDGVSAFDLISRRAMLEGLAHVPGGASALPFVHLFYGRPSRYLWEDGVLPVASRCGAGLPTRGVGCWVSGPFERCHACLGCIEDAMFL